MELYLYINSDKKKNIAYWDDMEDECRKLLDTILSDYASTNVSKIDEDTRIDISKSILETIIQKCGEYGIDTDAAFPYVDEDY